jgi:hypothetical protein
MDIRAVKNLTVFLGAPDTAALKDLRVFQLDLDT